MEMFKPLKSPEFIIHTPCKTDSFLSLKRESKDLTLSLTNNSITAVNLQKKILGRYKILKDKSLYFRNTLYACLVFTFLPSHVFRIVS